MANRMNTSIDCLPCVFRQALDAVRRISDDVVLHERVMREVAGWIHEADLSEPPPVLAQRLHRLLREMTGVADPYAEAKRRDNALALGLMPELRARLKRADDPFRLAVRLAIAGNQIDLGPKSSMSAEEVLESVRKVEEQPFSGDVEEFRRRADQARTIFYIADNAGEIVLDRLLIEALGPDKVTVAVRGRPVINDATMADAQTAGLCDICEVIPNGSDVPGTILKDCSEAFNAKFAAADMIVSKGQGNYETLGDNPRSICFLFKIKCPVIAAKSGFKLGTQTLLMTRSSLENGAPTGAQGAVQNTSTQNEEKNMNDKKMKIAIPLANGALCMHFGHCEQFALVDVDMDAKKVLGRKDVTPPPHEPGVLPAWLSEQGVGMILAGGMGQRAQNLFTAQNIEVMVGLPSETPETLIADLFVGTLMPGANVCDH